MDNGGFPWTKWTFSMDKGVEEGLSMYKVDIVQLQRGVVFGKGGLSLQKGGCP